MALTQFNIYPMTNLVPQENIENKILSIRGQRVMVDKDLAELYGVETKYLNRQVKRNINRFPKEFMFRLTKREKNELVTNWHRFKALKHSTTLPKAFTEHGVVMLAAVLNSRLAITISILVVKTFIRLRYFVLTHKKLANKLKMLEMRVDKHDEEIFSIFEAMHKLMALPEKPKSKIGFCIN